jgi:hypothetical protein
MHSNRDEMEASIRKSQCLDSSLVEGILLYKLSFLGFIKKDQRVSILRVGASFTNSEKLLVLRKGKSRKL